METNNIREVQFGELFDFVRNGLTVQQEKSSGGLPITRIETISHSTIDPLKMGYGGIASSEAKNWLLQPGDILFSHINSTDHIRYSDK